MLGYFIEDQKMGEIKMNQIDAAETSRLSDAIREIVPALEDFNLFRKQDLAAFQRSTWMAALDQPLPESGAGLQQVLHELTETIIPNGFRNGSPGFSGYVTTAPTTAGTAAALAATVAGSQRWHVHPFNFLETIALRWLAALLDIPSNWQGTFTSGGSIANIIGLGAARQWALERHGYDPSRDGLPPDLRFRVYASSEVHHVVIRAAAVLGLGRRAVAPISVDAKQRIDLDYLREAIEVDRAKGMLPIAIVANAGTANTGAIDPLEQMAEIASKYDTWLHVDGAYGLFGVLDPRVAPLFRGIERAGSVVVDPHKWLAAPVGCGAVFVRNRALLGRTFTGEPAEYLEGAVEISEEIHSPYDNFGELYHDFNLELSAPSRGVQVWAILKEVGAKGMRERVIQHNNFARHLASRVEKDDCLELLAAPVLSICCFRYCPPQVEEADIEELNAKIVNRLRADGIYVPSTTRVTGKLAIRPCYINPRTSISEVNGLVDQVREIGDSLLSR